MTAAEIDREDPSCSSTPKASTEVPHADLHVHATVRTSDLERAVADLASLGARGLERILLYTRLLPIPSERYHTMASRTPVDRVQAYLLSDGETPRDDAEQIDVVLEELGSRAPCVEVVPIVDHVDDFTFEALKDRIDNGARRVKLVNDAHIVPSDPVHTLKQHERVIEEMATVGGQIIIHIDLRDHGGWIKQMAREYDSVRMTIAHLGYSRAKMGELMDEHEGVIGDVANLAAHFRAKPDGYRQFMERYGDRLVFGSDSFLGDLRGMSDHVKALKSLGLSAGIEDGILQHSWARVNAEEGPCDG